MKLVTFFFNSIFQYEQRLHTNLKIINYLLRKSNKTKTHTHFMTFNSYYVTHFVKGLHFIVHEEKRAIHFNC